MTEPQTAVFLYSLFVTVPSFPERIHWLKMRWVRSILPNWFTWGTEIDHQMALDTSQRKFQNFTCHIFDLACGLLTGQLF